MPYPSLYLLGARLAVDSFASCSLRPRMSSFAIRSRSFSRPKMNRTCAYVPNETLERPFSTCHRVVREIPARCATCSAVNFLLRRASFMFPPVSSKTLVSLGSNIVFVPLIMFYILNKSSNYVQDIKR